MAIKHNHKYCPPDIDKNGYQYFFHICDFEWTQRSMEDLDSTEFYLFLSPFPKSCNEKHSRLYLSLFSSRMRLIVGFFGVSFRLSLSHIQAYLSFIYYYSLSLIYKNHFNPAALYCAHHSDPRCPALLLSQGTILHLESPLFRDFSNNCRKRDKNL